MKYTKSHFDNANTFTGNQNQQLLNYGNGLNNAASNSSSNGNISNGGNFNYTYNQNRKTPTSTFQQHLMQQQKQQQLIVDLSNPKKEYYNSLNRSTSINLGREKSSLSNYFATTNSNF